MTTLEEEPFDPDEFLELARGPRRVRTVEGQQKYGQPIGTIITPDMEKAAKLKGAGGKALAATTEQSGKASPIGASGKPGKTAAPSPGDATPPSAAAALQPKKTSSRVKKSSLEGPKQFKVGNSSYSAPKGSELYRPLGVQKDSLAFVRTPEGELHLFSEAGEVEMREDIALYYNDALGTDSKYEAVPFDDSTEDAPDFHSMQEGQVLSGPDGQAQFKKTAKGDWEHVDFGVKASDEEVKALYDKGDLTAPKTGPNSDLKAMSVEQAADALSKMKPGQTLYTDDEKSFVKKGPNMWESPELGKTFTDGVLAHLRGNLSKDNPNKNPEDQLQKPEAKPEGKAGGQASKFDSADSGKKMVAAEEKVKADQKSYSQSPEGKAEKAAKKASQKKALAYEKAAYKKESAKKTKTHKVADFSELKDAKPGDVFAIDNKNVYKYTVTPDGEMLSEKTGKTSTKDSFANLVKHEKIWQLDSLEDDIPQTKEANDAEQEAGDALQGGEGDLVEGQPGEVGGLDGSGDTPGEGVGDQLSPKTLPFFNGDEVPLLNDGVPLAETGRTKELKAAGATVPSLYELDSKNGGAQSFRAAMEKLKENNKYHASVYVYDEDEYKDMRLFTNDDGTAGFALHGDELVSVFVHADSKDKGAAKAMVSQAVANGAKRLDAFDTVLPKIYATEGFRPVARVKFDNDYKPEGWKTEDYSSFNGGEPDVVFMAYDNKSVGKEYEPGQGSYVDSYDEGVEVAKSATKRMTPMMDALGTHPFSKNYGKQKTSDEPDLTGWKNVGGQAGSNKGGFYEGPNGEQVYLKHPKSLLHGENEVLASDLYEKLGISSAQVKKGTFSGKEITYSPIIPNSKKDFAKKVKDPDYRKKVQDGFAVDAWLANWDVAGTGFDNVISDKEGNPVRVDPGGALLFRAMGASKGNAFGDTVGELDTFVDGSNSWSKAVFGDMSEVDKRESAKHLLEITDKDIDDIVDNAITDKKVAADLAATLKARRQDILSRYKLDVPDDNPEEGTTPEEKEFAEKVTELQDKLDAASKAFEEEHGGKDLHDIAAGGGAISSNIAKAFISDYETLNEVWDSDWNDGLPDLPTLKTLSDKEVAEVTQDHTVHKVGDTVSPTIFDMATPGTEIEVPGLASWFMDVDHKWRKFEGQNGSYGLQKFGSKNSQPVVFNDDGTLRPDYEGLVVRKIGDETYRPPGVPKQYSKVKQADLDSMAVGDIVTAYLPPRGYKVRNVGTLKTLQKSDDGTWEAYTDSGLLFEGFTPEQLGEFLYTAPKGTGIEDAPVSTLERPKGIPKNAVWYGAKFKSHDFPVGTILYRHRPTNKTGNTSNKVYPYRYMGGDQWVGLGNAAGVHTASHLDSFLGGQFYIDSSPETVNSFYDDLTYSGAVASDKWSEQSFVKGIDDLNELPYGTRLKDDAGKEYIVLYGTGSKNREIRELGTDNILSDKEKKSFEGYISQMPQPVKEGKHSILPQEDGSYTPPNPEGFEEEEGADVAAIAPTLDDSLATYKSDYPIKKFSDLRKFPLGTSINDYGTSTDSSAQVLTKQEDGWYYQNEDGSSSLYPFKYLGEDFTSGNLTFGNWPEETHGDLPSTDLKGQLYAEGPMVSEADLKEAIAALEAHSGFQIAYGLKSVPDNPIADPVTQAILTTKAKEAFPSLKPKQAVVAYLKKKAGVDTGLKKAEGPKIHLGSDSPVAGKQGADGGDFTPEELQFAINALKSYDKKLFKSHLVSVGSPVGKLDPSAFVGINKDKDESKKKFIGVLQDALDKYTAENPEEEKTSNESPQDNVQEILDKVQDVAPEHWEDFLEPHEFDLVEGQQQEALNAAIKKALRDAVKNQGDRKINFTDLQNMAVGDTFFDMFNYVKYTKVDSKHFVGGLLDDPVHVDAFISRAAAGHLTSTIPEDYKSPNAVVYDLDEETPSEAPAAPDTASAPSDEPDPTAEVTPVPWDAYYSVSSAEEMMTVAVGKTVTSKPFPDGSSIKYTKVKDTDDPAAAAWISYGSTPGESSGTLLSANTIFDTLPNGLEYSTTVKGKPFVDYPDLSSLDSVESLPAGSIVSYQPDSNLFLHDVYVKNPDGTLTNAKVGATLDVSAFGNAAEAGYLYAKYVPDYVAVKTPTVGEEMLPVQFLHTVIGDRVEWASNSGFNGTLTKVGKFPSDSTVFAGEWRWMSDDGVIQLPQSMLVEAMDGEPNAPHATFLGKKQEDDVSGVAMGKPATIEEFREIAKQNAAVPVDNNGRSYGAVFKATKANGDTDEYITTPTGLSRIQDGKVTGGSYLSVQEFYDDMVSIENLSPALRLNEAKNAPYGTVITANGTDYARNAMGEYVDEKGNILDLDPVQDANILYPVKPVKSLTNIDTSAVLTTKVVGDANWGSLGSTPLQEITDLSSLKEKNPKAVIYLEDANGKYAGTYTFASWGYNANLVPLHQGMANSGGVSYNGGVIYSVPEGHKVYAATPKGVLQPLDAIGDLKSVYNMSDGEWYTTDGSGWWKSYKDGFETDSIPDKDMADLIAQKSIFDARSAIDAAKSDQNSPTPGKYVTSNGSSIIVRNNGAGVEVSGNGKVTTLTKDKVSKKINDKYSYVGVPKEIPLGPPAQASKKVTTKAAELPDGTYMVGGLKHTVKDGKITSHKLAPLPKGSGTKKGGKVTQAWVNGASEGAQFQQYDYSKGGYVVYTKNAKGQWTTDKGETVKKLDLSEGNWYNTVIWSHGEAPAGVTANKWQGLFSQGQVLDPYGNSISPEGYTGGMLFFNSPTNAVDLKSVQDTIAENPDANLTNTLKEKGITVSSQSFVDYAMDNFGINAVEATSVEKKAILKHALDETLKGVHTEEVEGDAASLFEVNSVGEFKYPAKVAAATFNTNTPSWWSAPELSAFMTAASDSIGGGKVIGQGRVKMNKYDKIAWVKYFQDGNFSAMYDLEVQAMAKLGKPHPAGFQHPGYKSNKGTNQVSWGAAVDGEISALTNIEGDWSSIHLDASMDEINNYLIKAQMQNPTFLTSSEKRQWVNAHRQHKKAVIDNLSSLAKTRADDGQAPLSDPITWTDDVKPAKSYDSLFDDTDVPLSWNDQKATDYIADNPDNAKLQEYVSQFTGEWYASQKAVQAYFQEIWDTPVYSLMDDVQIPDSAHQVLPMKDQKNNKYFFKVAPPKSKGGKSRVEMEHAANVLSKQFGFSTPQSELKEVNGQYGQLQNALPAVSDMTGFDMKTLTKSQLSDLATEHVLDWFLNNDDAKAANMLIMANGRIVGIDKGRSFKHYGAWKGLSADASMNSNAQIVYAEMYDAIRSGAFSKEDVDRAYKAAIRRAGRIQKASDASIEETVRAGVQNRDTWDKKKTINGGITPQNADDLVSDVLNRKNSMVDDVTSMWEQIYKDAGLGELPDLTAGTDLGSVASGLDSTSWHESVLNSNSLGASTMISANGVIGGNMVANVIKSKDGSTQTMMSETFLAPKAQNKVLAWMQGHSVQDASMTQYGTKGIDKHDLYASPFINAAKTVNHHVDDKAYNTEHMNLFEESNKLLEGDLDAWSANMVLNANDEAVFPSGQKVPADQLAQYKLLLDHYKEQYTIISDAYKNQTKTSGMVTKFEPLDLGKPPTLYDGPNGMHLTALANGSWLKADKDGVSLVLSTDADVQKALDGADGWKAHGETDKIVDSGPKVIFTKTHEKSASVDDDGKLKYTGSDGQVSYSQGNEYTFELPTGEKIHFRNAAKTSTVRSQRGKLTFEIPNAGDPESVASGMERIMAQLEQMGLEMNAATEQDAELTYWHEMYGVLIARSHSPGSSYEKAYTDLVSSIKSYNSDAGTFPEDLVDAVGVEEANEFWRNLWGKHFGADKIDTLIEEKNYLPVTHGFGGDEEYISGRPSWKRFDVDYSDVLKAFGNKFLGSHSTTSAGKEGVAQSGMLLATEERLRVLGTVNGGMSSGADQSHGSSHGVFTRIKSGGSESGVDFIYNPRAMVYTRTYSFNGDHFGSLDDRSSSSPSDPKKAIASFTSGSNETLLPSHATLFDDLEMIVFEANQASKRDQLIQEWKKKGFEMIRGVPIEDRIVLRTHLQKSLEKVRQSWQTQQ